MPRRSLSIRWNRGLNWPSPGRRSCAIACLAGFKRRRGDDMTLAHEQRPRGAFNTPRNDWTRAEVAALFALPFPELIVRAALAHRENFDPTEVQISTLLSIKTGGCPEDCAYCPQSAKYDTGVDAGKLMSLDAVLAEARAAKA